MERITTSETLWDILGKVYNSIYRLKKIENILGDEYDLEHLKELVEKDKREGEIMPEYIDKSVVLDQISKQKLFYEEERKQSGDFLEEMNCVGAENGWTALEDVISDIPTADVAPVMHGKWILDAKNHCHCSRCLYGRNIETQIGWNYCPNCGAKCDLEG